MKSLINIFNNHELYVPSKLSLKKWADKLLSYHINCSIDYCFNINIVKSEEMRSFNFKYRKKNKTTNILSFPFQSLPGKFYSKCDLVFLGDMIICPNVLEDEAKKQKKKLNDHWCHIFIHGILHLLGYDHQTLHETKIMESLETSLLKDFNIADPYL